MKKYLLLVLIAHLTVLVLTGCPEPAANTPVEASLDYTSANIGTLKYVAGGTFNNGTANMTVSSFRMSQFEITRAWFLSIMGTDPSSTSYSSGTNNPVQMVNWYQAIAFCNKLSLAEGLTPIYTVNGITDWANFPYSSIPLTTSAVDWNNVSADWTANGYRLPTEAEWEYAARGGNETKHYVYAGSDAIADIAVFGFSGIETGRTTTARSNPVGSKTAGTNELGLYDLSGNVFELCWDWYGDYPSIDQTDYRGVLTGEYRINRGGCWWNDAYTCEVSFRNNLIPENRGYVIGFRVVRN